MEAGEAELHLGLDPDCPRDSKITRGADHMLEECGFADPWLAAEDEGPAHSKPNGVEDSGERRLLMGSINEIGALCSSDRTGGVGARLRRPQSHSSMPMLGATD